MRFVRCGSGCGAAEVAFATVFGPVVWSPTRLTIKILPGADGRLLLPWHGAEALSTDR